MKLKVHILGILLFLLPVLMIGQVRPDQFPLEANPDNDNFEVYSQKEGTNTRASMDALRTYLSAEVIDSVSDPALFGNPDNLKNKIIRVTNGKVWFVDYKGDGVVIVDNTTLHFYQRYAAPDTDTLLFSIYYPFSNDRLQVFENGKKLIAQEEYSTFQGMVVLNWRIPFLDYEIIIK